MGQMTVLTFNGDDPDPMTFGLSDPVFFLPDPDPTFNNGYII